MTSGFDKFNKPMGFGQGLTPMLDQPNPSAPAPMPPQGQLSPAPAPAPGMPPKPRPGPVADYPGDDGKGMQAIDDVGQVDQPRWLNVLLLHADLALTLGGCSPLVERGGL